MEFLLLLDFVLLITWLLITCFRYWMCWFSFMFCGICFLDFPFASHFPVMTVIKFCHYHLYDTVLSIFVSFIKNSLGRCSVTPILFIKSTLGRRLTTPTIEHLLTEKIIMNFNFIDCFIVFSLFFLSQGSNNK